MKILVIAGGFFPAQNYGGPPVSIKNLCTLIKDDINFYILAVDHDLNEKKRLIGIQEGWIKQSSFNVRYLRKSELNYQSYIEIIQDIEPNIIYLNSLFDRKFVIPFLKLSKNMRINVLLAPRGQLCNGALKKKYKKLPYLYFYNTLLKNNNVYFHSTSNEETHLIMKHIHVDKKRIFFMPNVPVNANTPIINRTKELNVLKLIFLSRIHPKKNLIMAIKLLKDIKGEVYLDIYGPIEDLSYWRKCETQINKLPSNVKVKYMGLVSRNEIISIFAKYDLFLFPTHSENYGHVIAESMISGTPVMISDQTPWTDLRRENAGWVLSLDDFTSWQYSLQNILNMSNDDFIQYRENTKKYIRNKNNLLLLKEKYIETFNKLV